MAERITENLVRDAFRELGFYESASKTKVEEQKSANATITKLLKTAGKAGNGGKGAPEFILTNPDSPDFVVIFECKAKTTFHESPTLDQSVDYAVDGALHYAKFLSKEFNVIAVAYSGTSLAEAKISTFLHPKGSDTYRILKTKTGAPILKVLPWNEYIEHGTYDPAIQRLRHDELMAFSRELHDFMRDHAKLTESEKPLLISGTLIALQNQAFAKSYDAYKPEDLQKQWLAVIKDEIEKAQIPNGKKLSMTQPYASISVHPELSKPTAKHPRGPLFQLIKDIGDKVLPFISIYHDFDVVGQFYGEFLKYTGGDKKALGIVLTPRHVTELFAKLANIKKTDTVLDICAGTGGFLVSAMHHMMRQAQTQAEKDRIKQHGLIGVEQQPNMFALAASNMILRGDGKANLHQGSCFDSAITDALRGYHCNVGLINPPYAQGDEDLHELVFVKHMLDCLEPNGVGIAIVPMSCAISPNKMREELMKHHTLEAVMSMPGELFYPVGTVTCIMVWRAHTPHFEIVVDAATDKIIYKPYRKTWFGYWKDDGFIKTKHKGRIDASYHWEGIRDRWVEMYTNREVHAGESVMQAVTPDDEWCAEAYMETDYSKITQADFEKVVRDYALFKLIGADSASSDLEDSDE